MVCSLVKMLKPKLLFGFTFFWFVWVGMNPLLAQRFPLRTYSVEEGLAQSGVTDLIQDDRAHLWIATMGGISRFDGTRFVNYVKNNGFPAEEANCLLQDRKGNIWVGTNRGLVRSYGEGSNIDHFDLIQHPLFRSQPVGGLFEDRRGRVWIHLNGGLFFYENDTYTAIHFKQMPQKLIGVRQGNDGTLWIATSTGLFHFNESTGEPELFMPMDIKSQGTFHIDRRQQFWLGGNEGLYRVDRENRRLVNMTAGMPPKSIRITDIAEDQVGNLWLPTLTGLLHYDRRAFRLYDRRHGLPPTLIAAVVQDREGNIWLGTGGNGIIKFNDTFAIHDTSTGLVGDLVLTFITDRRNRLWYGTMGGICVETADGFRCRQFEGMGNVVRDATIDEQGRLWFATIRGVYSFNGDSPELFADEQFFEDSGSETIFHDSRGRLFMGNGSGAFILDGDTWRRPSYLTALTDLQIWTIIEDRQQRVWFGTKFGLFVLDGEHMQHLTTARDQIVSSLIQDSQGDLWFGIFGGGVGRLSGNVLQDEPDWFKENHGLSNDFVYSLIFDDDGFLWVGTNKGINRLDVRRFRTSGEKRVKRYGLGEGFTGVECNRNAVFKAPDGALWFGTVKGALRYNPHRDRLNTKEPVTSINGLRLFYEPVDWRAAGHDMVGGLPAKLTLPYDQNHLTFDFVGVSLSNPNKVRYRYRLQGFLDGWSPVTTERTATYSNLPPGNYSFQVLASNSDGVWNVQPTRYNFTIASPVWGTWWFQTAIGLLVLFMLLVLLLLYQRRLAKQAEVAMRARLGAQQQQKLESLGRLAGGIAHDFNNMLASMMGFNALAKLEIPAESVAYQHLEEVDRSGHRAKELIKQILTFSRQGKPEFKPVFIVDAVRDALKMAKISFPSGIVLKQRLNPETGWVMGDPTQIQQIILNLCANGRQAIQSERGLVSVDVALRPGSEGGHDLESTETYVVISVEDTGQGMDEDTRNRVFEPFFTTKVDGQGSGMGLAVIHGIVTAMKGAIQVASQPGKGTRFDVWLPCCESPMVQEEPSFRTVHRGHGQNVLFVDDEPAQVKAHVTMLEHLGYHATGMTDSQRALIRFKQDPDAYDLVVTDLRIPGMRGDALAREIWRLRPDKPILLLTGVISDYSKADALRDGFTGYLVKPFTMAELGKALTEALGEENIVHP